MERLRMSELREADDASSNSDADPPLSTQRTTGLRAVMAARQRLHGPRAPFVSETVERYTSRARAQRAEDPAANSVRGGGGGGADGDEPAIAAVGAGDISTQCLSMLSTFSTAQDDIWRLFSDSACNAGSHAANGAAPSPGHRWTRHAADAKEITEDDLMSHLQHRDLHNYHTAALAFAERSRAGGAGRPKSVAATLAVLRQFPTQRTLFTKAIRKQKRPQSAQSCLSRGQTERAAGSTGSCARTGAAVRRAKSPSSFAALSRKLDHETACNASLEQRLAAEDARLRQWHQARARYRAKGPAGTHLYAGLRTLGGVEWTPAKCWSTVLAVARSFTACAGSCDKLASLRAHKAHLRSVVFIQAYARKVLRRRRGQQLRSITQGVARAGGAVLVANFRRARREKAVAVVRTVLGKLSQNKVSVYRGVRRRFFQAIRTIQRFVRHLQVKRAFYLTIMQHHWMAVEEALAKRVHVEEIRRLRADMRRQQAALLSMDRLRGPRRQRPQTAPHHQASPAQLFLEGREGELADEQLACLAKELTSSWFQRASRCTAEWRRARLHAILIRKKRDHSRALDAYLSAKRVWAQQWQAYDSQREMAGGDGQLADAIPRPGAFLPARPVWSLKVDEGVLAALIKQGWGSADAAAQPAPPPPGKAPFPQRCKQTPLPLQSFVATVPCVRLQRPLSALR
ncbi:hypothetical protein DIPPA_26370 [Diplonema papillatum]|nr:hypothetical protein DIPPA_26370 [Diplonema papillatum]